MSKQDRQGARTPAQLEQEFQFGKSFAEAMGLAQEAKDEAQEAKKATEDLDKSLDPTEIFNRLTNNGEAEGIYRDEKGNIYINASYLKSGIIDAAVVQVVNLIAERLKSVSGSSVLNIDGANLEFRSNENRTMWLTNTYEGQPRLYLWEFDGDSRVNTSEMSPHHLKIGGTSTMPKFAVELPSIGWPGEEAEEEWSKMEVDSINPGKKLLFSGNVTMGNSCEVPGANRYDLFAIKLGDSANTYRTVVLAYKIGNVVRGVGGWAGTATESKQLYFFSATISGVFGNTWTVEDAGVHNVYIGGTVEEGNRLNLKEIIGVI